MTSRCYLLCFYPVLVSDEFSQEYIMLAAILDNRIDVLGPHLFNLSYTEFNQGHYQSYSRVAG